MTLWILNLPNPTGSLPYFPFILATTHPLLTVSPHSERGAVKFGFNPVKEDFLAASLGTRERRNRQPEESAARLHLPSIHPSADQVDKPRQPEGGGPVATFSW